MKKILCTKEYRKVSKNHEISYKSVVYQILLDKPYANLRGATVTISEGLRREIAIEYRGKPLRFRKFIEQEFTGEVVSSKEIDRFLSKKPMRRKAPYNHPWKKQTESKIKILQAL